MEQKCNFLPSFIDPLHPFLQVFPQGQYDKPDGANTSWCKGQSALHRTVTDEPAIFDF